MKNKTLAIILLLCTALVPTGFAGESPRNRSNYSNIKLVKIDPKSENYAMGTLKMLSDKFNELLDLLKKERNNIKLDSNQQKAYTKDLKLLTFSYYDFSMKNRPYSRTYARIYAGQLFKGLSDYLYHPMYMLVDPCSGRDFGWLTCSPSSKFSDMLDIFVENIRLSEDAGYYDDVGLCLHYLRRIVRSKLEKVLEIKNFYNKCPTNSDNAIVVFENIILLIKKFKIQNDLAIKHLEFVVRYAKSKENSEALLKKIEHIVTNNIGHFANSVEEMAFVQFKIR